VKKIIVFLIFLPLFAQSDSPKTKFYDFEDLLINGEFKKPQVMYIDDQSKVKKNLLQKLRNTNKDASLR
jgi:hypothetical protein